jgi:voltage-dependent potassium channel beta subunit
MIYRNLGNSGLKVSILSVGSWVTFGKQLDHKAIKRCLTLAYEQGINLFDTAESYGRGLSEEMLGKALKELSFARSSICLSSKVFFGGDWPTQKGLSRKHIMEACHNSLKRLHVDYLDLFFCHRPDPETPLEETVRAMHHLIMQGKILYWGTSEWSAADIMEVYSLARQYGLTPPTMEQPQYNLLHRDRVEVEYKRLFSKLGLGATIYSPLSSGLLTGKYLDGIPKDSRATFEGYDWVAKQLSSNERHNWSQILEELRIYSADLGISMSQLAIAWCMKNPNVSSVIMGISNIDQLRENLDTIHKEPLLTKEKMEFLATII